MESIASISSVRRQSASSLFFWTLLSAIAAVGILMIAMVVYSSLGGNITSSEPLMIGFIVTVGVFLCSLPIAYLIGYHSRKYQRKYALLLSEDITGLIKLCKKAVEHHDELINKREELKTEMINATQDNSNFEAWRRRTINELESMKGQANTMLDKSKSLKRRKLEPLVNDLNESVDFFIEYLMNASFDAIHEDVQKHDVSIKKLEEKKEGILKRLRSYEVDLATLEKTIIEIG